MDALGRGKTAIAGTFAIHRQITSNWRPISGVERNARRRDRKGIYARSEAAPEEWNAGAHARAKGGGGGRDFPRAPGGPPGGKTRARSRRWYPARALSPENL